MSAPSPGLLQSFRAVRVPFADARASHFCNYSLGFVETLMSGCAATGYNEQWLTRAFIGTLVPRVSYLSLSSLPWYHRVGNEITSVYLIIP